jgi:hypothetical protein
MDPAVTLNDALVAPLPTVTPAGAGRVALLLEMETLNTLAAALVKDTVQEELCPLFKLAGEQLMEASAAGASRLIVAVRVTAAADAVTTALASAATCAPVALKLAVVCPDATDTVAGTERLALLLDKPTENPPEGAAAVSVTVQPTVPGV